MPINKKLPLQKEITLEDFSQVMSVLSLKGPIKVAVAVSGGSDSMCLAIFLKKWSKISGIEVIALIVNHGLREGIEKEINQTREWLSLYNIETKVLKIDNLNSHSKVQENARLARYTVLINFCKDNNICYLAVAHHFNDLIETIHMREVRKPTIVGHSGISVVKNYKKVLIFRPLLFFTKKAIQNTLKNLQQSWIEDPSNHNIKFERCLIRQQIGELTDKQILNYFNKYNALRNYRISLEKDSLNFFIENVFINNFGVIKVNFRSLLKFKEELIIYILRILISFCANNTYMTKIYKIKNFLKLLQFSIANNKVQKFTVGGCLINLQKNNSFLIIKEGRLIKDHSVINNNENIIWDDRFLIKNLNKFPKNYFFANLTSKEYNILHKNKSFKELEKNLNLSKEILISLPWLFDISKKPVFYWINYLQNMNYMQFFPKKSLLQDLFWNFSIDKLYHLY